MIFRFYEPLGDGPIDAPRMSGQLRIRMYSSTIVTAAVLHQKQHVQHPTRRPNNPPTHHVQ